MSSPYEVRPDGTVHIPATVEDCQADYRRHQSSPVLPPLPRLPEDDD